METVEYTFDDFEKDQWESSKERLRKKKSDKVIATKHYNFPIREYTKRGRYIKTWPNIKTVEDSNKNIHHLAFRNHLFKYKPLIYNNRIYLKSMDRVEDRLLLIEQEKKIQKEEQSTKEAFKRAYEESIKVNAYSSKGEFLGTFDTNRQAAEYFNTDIQKVYNSLRGRILVTRNKIIFLYTDDSIEERLKIIKSKRSNWLKTL